MHSKDTELSPHSRKVLDALQKSAKPLTAYELLDKLRKFGIKAPPTVYRALDSLLARGLIHRIETLGAFVACHHHEDAHHNSAQFAVCRSCGNVTELHDARLMDVIQSLASALKFRIEREMLELMGLCQNCSAKAGT